MERAWWTPRSCSGRVVLMLVAYLAGSIPVGVLVARLRAAWTRGRSAPAGPAAPTRCGRSGRKWAAVVVARRPRSRAPCRSSLARIVTGGDPLVEVLCGAAAVAGAIWSVFAGFRSGRGVGTGRRHDARHPAGRRPARGAGVHRGDPDDPLRVARVAARVGRDVPGDAARPARRARTTPLPYVVYSAVGAALIWLAHADNIDRLLHGTERKFDLGMLAGKRSAAVEPGAQLESPTGVQSERGSAEARAQRSRATWPGVNAPESVARAGEMPRLDHDPGRLTTGVEDHAGSAGRGRPAPRG